MILVDTSVWIDHLRSGEDRLATLLTQNSVLAHPFVSGELALGTLRRPDNVLGLLGKLPQAMRARDEEVLSLIRRRNLAGHGIGYVEAHMLASTLLTPHAALWTRDKRLHAIAVRFGVAAPLP